MRWTGPVCFPGRLTVDNRMLADYALLTWRLPVPVLVSSRLRTVSLFNASDETAPLMTYPSPRTNSLRPVRYTSDVVDSSRFQTIDVVGRCVGIEAVLPDDTSNSVLPVRYDATFDLSPLYTTDTAAITLYPALDLMADKVFSTGSRVLLEGGCVLGFHLTEYPAWDALGQIKVRAIGAA